MRPVSSHKRSPIVHTQIAAVEVLRIFHALVREQKQEKHKLVHDCGLHGRVPVRARPKGLQLCQLFEILLHLVPNLEPCGYILSVE